MLRNNKVPCFTLVSLLAVAVLTGCQNSANDVSTKDNVSANQVDQHQPVTLTFYAMPSMKNQLQTEIVDPVQKKFPYITLQVIDSQSNQDTAFNNFVAANTIPDLMLLNYSSLRILKSLGIAQDLSPMIKSNNVDITKFMPSAIEYLKQYSNHNEIYGLPYFLNVNVFNYNKSIFDKFGVAPPHNGMTWDEVTELAKQVTRSADGVDYLGLNPGRPYVVAPQLSLDVIDSKTNQATVNNDGWKQVFQLFQNIYNIPGNRPQNVNDFWQASNSFFKNQNLAMNLLWWDQTLAGLQATQGNNGMDWDMVTAPVFAQNPKVAQWLDQFDLSVSTTSKNQKEAFQVINYLTSSEYQTQLSKDGYITPLNDQAIQQQFGSNLPFLKGKNIQAIFKVDYAKPLTSTKFNLNSVIDPFYQGVIYNNTDINTTLLNMEQKINQVIQQNS